MRRVAVFLSGLMLCAMLIGCGDNGAAIVNVSEVNEQVMETQSNDASGVQERNTTFTVGDPDGVHLEMWSFQELHNAFYARMVDRWNKRYPSKKVEVTFTSYSFNELLENLEMTLNEGIGAPDICDLEIGQFPQIMDLADEKLYPLNDAMEKYEKDILQSRLDVYSKDGVIYGVPTHVGTTVMYYNTKILESYGIDYTTIKTWEDYTRVGALLAKASNGEVALTAVDTGTVDWEYLAMAEYDENWIDEESNTINIEQESLKKMLTMQQDWLNSGVAVLTCGGNVDCEAGVEMLASGQIASFPKAIWFMSRFVNYMPQMDDVWAIAPCPVFESGQRRSVGLGGTGTVVTLQSDNPELAAEFITYAKCSAEGCIQIWKQLGFDVCNTSLWKNESIAKDEKNRFISYFVTNPFDVLNEVESEITTINVTDKTQQISQNMLSGTLSRILEKGEDVDTVLKEAQKELQGD